jgi:hypothetical protein
MTSLEPFQAAKPLDMTGSSAYGDNSGNIDTSMVRWATE